MGFFTSSGDGRLFFIDRKTGDTVVANGADEAAKLVSGNPNLEEYPGLGANRILEDYYGIRPNGDAIGGAGILHNLLGNGGNVPGQKSANSGDFLSNILFGFSSEE